jgi:hypothetical protein
LERSYLPGVETGFFSGVDFTFPLIGCVPLPGDATGDATGLAVGVAVAAGVAVDTGLTLLVPPLLVGDPVHAPRTAVAARIVLRTNDLLIFLLVPSLG